MNNVTRRLIIKGASGQMRTAQFQGREHIVLPITALVEGVIFPLGAKKPEFAAADSFSMAPQGWDGRPVFLNHPLNGDEPISGNTPELLEHSFGTAFAAKAAEKKLLMDLYLDPARMEAEGDESKKILERVKKNEPIEVSVGALIGLEMKAGEYKGKKYDAVWKIVVPDHIALLPEGAVGACSNDMGCGVRSMVLHTLSDKGIDFEGSTAARQPSRFVGIWNRITEMLRAAHGDYDLGLSDSDKRQRIQEVLSQNEAGAWLEQVYEDYIIYCVYEGATTKYFQRGYVISDEGVVGFDSDKSEVEPVLSYEPVEASARITSGKGAKISKENRSKVQSIHDMTTELGATCTGMTAAGRAACSCRKQGAAMKTKVERIKALIENPKSPFGKDDQKLLEGVTEEQLMRYESAAGGTLLDAIIAQIAEKLKLSDTAKSDLSNLSEETLAELAGISLGDGGSGGAGGTDSKDNAPAAGGSQQQKGAARVVSTEDWLKNAPKEVTDLVTRQRNAEQARRDSLVPKLKAAQSVYTEEELKKMDIDALERLAKVANIDVEEVDFSARGLPRAAVTSAETIPNGYKAGLEARAKTAAR